MPRESLGRVRALTKKLTDVEVGTTFGFPAFKVSGKTFAWFPKKKEVEPGSLGVRMSILEREYRIAAEPSVYYVTPHYKDYASVLARIEQMSDAALRELLESGHEYMVSQRRARSPNGAANDRDESVSQSRTLRATALRRPRTSAGYFLVGGVGGTGALASATSFHWPSILRQTLRYPPVSVDGFPPGGVMVIVYVP